MWLKVVLPFILLTAVTIASEPEKRTCIGAVNGGDAITIVHITNLLLGHGILSEIWGHMWFQIDVPVGNAAEAKRLLRKDAPVRGYRVDFGDYGGKDFAGAYVEPKARVSSLDLKDIFKRAEYSRKTLMGHVLRSKDVSQRIRKYPYVVALRTTERPYLTKPDTLITGYDVEIELNTVRAKLGDPTNHFVRFQILENGKVNW